MTTETSDSVQSSPTATHRYQRLAVFGGLVVVALAARFYFVDYKSIDYVDYYHQWYDYIRDHGGFAALGDEFSNYNMPYLYLLAATTYLPIPPLIAVKLIPVLFDALLGWYAYRIIALRHPTGWPPILGAGVVVLLPTVVLDSAMWGQPDSVYVSLGLGSVYYLLCRRPWAACILFGLAFAVKLQAIVLAPVLLLLVLRKWVPWRALLAIPAVYLLLELPALLLGAGLRGTLLVYYYQATRDMLIVYYDRATHKILVVNDNRIMQQILHKGGGETTFSNYLTVNTPSIHRYLGFPPAGFVQPLVLVATAVIVLGLIAVVVRRKVELSATEVLLAATTSALLLPFMLPKMHCRYFLLADVLAVIAAFWLPRKLWPVPVLVQFASLFSYLPYLLLPYRLRDLSGNPDVADGSGLSGSGFVEPHSMVDTLPTLGPRPFSRLDDEVLGPVVDYRVLATITAIALIYTLVVTTRQFASRTPEKLESSG